jgi:predicted alpha/beta-fold hydrolase
MDPFRPFPLLGNPHVQTLLGNFLAGPRLRLASVAEFVLLPDADQIVMHVTTAPAWRPGGPIAVLVHGLGGSSESGYMRRITELLATAGVRVCRLDLRGCGAGVSLARRFYCAAGSDDIRAVLEHLHARHPGSPLLLAGFSLGGGIVLKAAGEFRIGGLGAVAAVAPPLDLIRCSELIRRQPLFDAFYVRNLVRQVRDHERHRPDLRRMRFPRRLTLRQFDDLYTAPRWGFAGVDDYYHKASALPWVSAIRIPTFLLTARDDPFIAVESFEELAPAPHREVHISPRGGHLGFLGPDGRGGVRWAERRVVDWLLGQAGRVVNGLPMSDNDATLPSPSR